MSSIRESFSDSEASESSIKIQTSPAPRGLITKEPFKGPVEVEAITPSNRMDLDQDIQVKNPEDKNVSPEEAQMEDARTPTSSQRLASTFDTLIENPESDITAIPVVRPESFPIGSHRDIPVSVQELVYGGKAGGVGTSAKSLDRHNELLSSSEEVHGPTKERRASEGLDTLFLQRTSPTDKSLVEKPKHVVRGPEEEVGQRKGQKPSGSSPSLHKQNSASTSSKQGQESPKVQSEGQAKGKGKGKIQVEQALPTESQNSQEREDSHGQCVQYGKSSDGIQK
ncbi:hypothetical protein O181_049988 [Austropuccinia psidii MF-1]|uniref:Uncharacterized protein n=1 Tax=Austropuccinia psidii MF-1 TaxID=1389203 RepID=A0A9Q3DYH1_9BASI|nr:hypothetical protein [Austropuccinia psidii MF-1]